MTVVVPWRGVGERLEAGHPVFVVRVVDHTDHSPGTRGAMLWMAAGEAPSGTIGGGAMEQRVVERGRDWLAVGRRRVVLEDLHHRADAEGLQSGLICAGRQTNVSMLLEPEVDGSAIDRIVRRLEEDRSVVWRIGSDRVLEAREVEHAGDSVRIERVGGWEVRELLFQRRRIAVFGGGHCGAALARTMAGLRWRVDVWESRSEIASELRASLEADRFDGVVVHEVADLAAGGAEIVWPRWTPAVVMTTNLVQDVRALEGLLGVRGLPFLGLMGAPAKLEQIRRRLLASRWTRAAVDRIVAPVGLPIGSDTPEEIAISVAAQILERRGDWIGTDARPSAED